MSYGSKQLSVAPYRECPKPTVLVYQSLDPAMCESALVECDNILTSAPSLIATSDSSCSHGRKCPTSITTCITASMTPLLVLWSIMQQLEKLISHQAWSLHHVSQQQYEVMRSPRVGLSITGKQNDEISKEIGKNPN